MSSNKILVVDDEVGIRDLLAEILWDEGYQVTHAENAEQARASRKQTRPDLVLLDIWMPDTDGITLLKEWASSGLLTMPVIMMSGHGTIDSAVEATRIGACDFLEKPIALNKLLSTVKKALQQGQTTTSTPLTISNLGKSDVMIELKKRLEHAMNISNPVLLTGEPGSEMELCARFLHRQNTPWVELDSASLRLDSPEILLGQAKEGSIFIKEIGELGKEEQKKFLLFLRTLDKHDIRLVCATTFPLPLLVAEGKYDAALFQALSSLTIPIPSLREHKEDIPNLANLLLSRYVESKETPLKLFSTAALNALRNYDWPGNLSQLKAVVKSLALTSLGDEISLEDTKKILLEYNKSSDMLALPLDMPLRDARDVFEKIYFEYHIEKEKGSMGKIAANAGIERTHLYRKLKQLGIKFQKNKDDL